MSLFKKLVDKLSIGHSNLAIKLDINGYEFEVYYEAKAKPPQRHIQTLYNLIKIEDVKKNPPT